MSEKKYTTIQQHEPLRVPANWGGQEKKLIVQLEEILDDIYRRFGRLRLEDLRPDLRKTIIESTEGFSSLEQTVEGFKAVVEDANGNASLALQTANSFSERITDAEGNASEALQTASSFSERISDAEGNASKALQTAQGFEQRVSDAEENASEALQTAKGFEQRVSNAENDASEALQTAQGFEQRVSDAEGNAANAVLTANQAKVEIGSFQVGGVNLIADTRLMASWAKSGGTRPVGLSVDNEGFGVLSWPADANKAWARAMQNNSDRKPYSVYRNKDVTVSFEFRSEAWGNGDWMMIYFYVDEDETAFYRNRGQAVVVSGTKTWQKVQHTFRITDDFFTGGTGTLRQEGLLNIFLANNCAGACEIRKFKVEIGNKATDWSPAPEDGAYTASAVLDRTGIHLNTGGTFTVDSQNFGVDGSGKMTAKAGLVGGWDIAPGNLSSGSGTKHVRLSVEDATYAIWAGAETGGSAPFRVTRDGKVYLTKLYVTDENGNAQANPVNLSGSWWRTNRAVQSMEVSGNTLTITLYDGTTVNFKKADVVALDQSWANGRQTITTTTDGITLSGETTTSVNGTPANLTWSNNVATFNVTSDKGTIYTGMKLDAGGIYKNGWNECIDNCSGAYVLTNYYEVGETLYDKDGNVAAGPWYKGTRAYRYTIPAKKT